jgi:hypothetical protein
MSGPMVKQKWYTSPATVSFEYDDQWLGQGVCFDAAATFKSCIMVNVPKIVQKHIGDNKNKEYTLWRLNKSQQMIIPGMGKVGCQRIGLGSFRRSEVRCRVQHGGSNAFRSSKIEIMKM